MRILNQNLPFVNIQNYFVKCCVGRIYKFGIDKASVKQLCNVFVSKDGCQISEGVWLQCAYESVDDIY